MPPTAATEVSPDNLEQYRRELTGYCYRMLGSGFEAEDAVQETMLRAWRAAEGFEGRSSVRSWLYRIATNICLDMLRGRQRRALPMDLGPASPPVEALLGEWHPDDIWITPISDATVMPEHGDPAEIAVARDTIRLAFITALQHLPARQRATLILCEVLKMPAAEAAATLGTSVAAVNSALQRARATLAALPEEQRPAVGRRGAVRAAGLLRRRVPAVRHGAAGHAAARRRADDDAAVRLLGQGRAEHHQVDARAVTQRLPGLDHDPGRPGQRLPGLGPVQAGSRRAGTRPGRCRCTRCPAGGSAG